MARGVLDQMTAWMIGVAGTGLLFGAGYGVYKLALRSAALHNEEKIAVAVAEFENQNHHSPEMKPHGNEEKHASKTADDQEKPESHRAGWSYSGSTGPANWARIDDKYSVCATGKQQSPINISETHTDPKGLALKFDYSPSRVTLKNFDHTVLAEFGSRSNYLTFEGERFDLVQFHFHAPAEHRLQDSTIAFEMHLEHRSVDNKLAILSILFNTGAANKVLADVFDHIPGDVGAQAPDALSFDPSKILPSRRSYYTYKGSQTTPPCAEGVTWLVMQNQLEISMSQLKKFENIFGRNARPTVPGSRSILLIAR